MSDLGIFNGKNDLAKFLSIGGLFFIVFSIVYPVEKRKELDLLVARNNSEIRILNGMISSANDELTIIENRKKELDSQKLNISVDQVDIKLEQVRKMLISQTDSIVKTLTDKKLEIDHVKDQLNIAQHYSDEYGGYLSLLTRVGWGMLIIGLIGWLLSARKEYRKP